MKLENGITDSRDEKKNIYSSNSNHLLDYVKVQLKRNFEKIHALFLELQFQKFL